MSKLKPCPFCGSEDLVSQWDTQGDYEQHYYWEIWCNKCGHGEVLGPSLPRAKSKAVTIDLWNTRPIEDKLQAELAIDKESRIKAEQLLAETQSENQRLQDDVEECEALNSTQAVSLRKQAEEIEQYKSNQELYGSCLLIMSNLKALYESSPDFKSELTKTACQTWIKECEEGLRNGRARQMEKIIRQQAEEIERLKDELDNAWDVIDRTINIICTDKAITDTIWYGDGCTLVDLLNCLKDSIRQALKGEPEQ